MTFFSIAPNWFLCNLISFWPRLTLFWFDVGLCLCLNWCIMPWQIPRCCDNPKFYRWTLNYLFNFLYSGNVLWITNTRPYGCQKCKLYILCTLTLGEITLGQFGHFHDMCIKYTPSKCVAFSSRFYFWCLGFIFLLSQS
jgi:hypothetical protein